MTSTMISFCLPILLLSSFLSYASASPGDSTVQCMKNTTWMDNSKGQSPCVVAAKLINTDNCLKGVGNINPLKQGEIYPNNGKPNDACMCNDPIYSLFSACAACQNFDFQDWAQWTKGCNNVYSTYQGNVPSDTEIPGWALLSVESKGNFDITAALNAAQAAASSSSANHETSTSSATSSSTSTETSTSDSSAPTNGGGGGSSSKAGPIAGGVIGGLAFLGLLAGLGFWYRRRRQRPSPHNTTAPMLASYGPKPNASRSPGPPPYTGELEANPGRTSLSGRRMKADSQFVPMKLYDPSDPSTFPDAAPTQADAQTGIPMANMTIQYGPGSRVGHAGTGNPVPEV